GFIIIASWLIGKLTVGDELKIIKDVGLSSIHFFGILITIFSGISLVFREMERRTIYLILSKPVERHEFLLGKFLGLAWTLLAVLLSLGAIFCIILLMRRASLNGLLGCLFLSYLDGLIVAGISLLF